MLRAVCRAQAVGSRFVVWGHSQGGHAALFTGLIAKNYAPELTLLGVAAAAPASELTALMDDDLDTIAGKNITAMTLWSWQRVYGAPMDRVVDPRAMPAIDKLARECIEGPWDISTRNRTTRPLEQHFLTVAHPADVQPWRDSPGEEHARPAAARSSGVPRARSRRCGHPAGGDAGLF